MAFRLDTPPSVGPFGVAEQIDGRWRVRVTDDGHAVAAEFFAAWPEPHKVLTTFSPGTLAFARAAGMTPEDIDAAARAGVLNAVARWQPGRKLATYAAWWVRSGVQKAAERVSREWRLSGKATWDGMAIGEKQDATTLALVEARPDPDGDPERRDWRRLLAVRVREAMATVPARHRDIFAMRNGLDGEPGTLQQTADAFGISRERVRQICDSVATRLWKRLRDLRDGGHS
jgi:RNA polymerase sigma factor (sigma-70 family)